MPSDVLPVAAAISDSALRRAFHRWSAGPLHVGDWLITFITMATVVTTCVVLTQVLNSDQAGLVAWASRSVGGFLLCAGARLRGCAAARLRGCAAARLRGCAAARH